MSQCPLSVAHQGPLNISATKRKGILAARDGRAGEKGASGMTTVQDGDFHSNEPSESKPGDPESYFPQTIQGSKS